VTALAWLLLGAAQAAPPAAEAPSRDVPVLAATVRGVANELLTHEVRETGAVACVLIDRDGMPEPPPEEFLSRLEALPFLRSGEACEATPEGVFESSSGAPAYLITVGPVEWIAPDEGHVGVVFRREGAYTHRRLYRVVREPTGWVSLGQIIEMSPA